jgi:hypothetical protein
MLAVTRRSELLQPSLRLPAEAPGYLVVAPQNGEHNMMEEEDAPPVKVPHVSYSSLKDYLGCGKYWQLKRLMGLPERPAVWNIGGHAVHAAIDSYNRTCDGERAA